jgi:hypothetical protein
VAALCCVAGTAHAEYRTVLIRLKTDKDNKTLVTIYSDDNPDPERKP